MILAIFAMALQSDRDVIHHQFTYVADKTLKSVFVAGTFNNWSSGTTPMQLDPDGRTWRRSVELQPGKHLYKFVLEGTNWITDPKAAKNEDDGNGNTNSVLLLLPKAYETPATPGDKMITESALRHEQSAPFFNYDQGRLDLVLRVRPKDLTSVALVVNGKQHETAFRSSNEFFEFVRCGVEWNRKSDLRYHFLLREGAIEKVYGPKGLSDTANGNEFLVNAKSFKPFEVSPWVEGSVFYQIFPDRFENGDKRNDPKGTVPWGTKASNDLWFGGDVAGVRKRSNYLKDLGVDAVYFNPIFQSPVIHRYETTDFLKVDPRFGTNAEFAELTKHLEALGIRTVLDGVFNHVAPDFFAFRDLLKNQEKSAYKDWFFVKKFPVKVEPNPNYEAWWGYQSMPKLNVKNPEVRKHLLKVPEFWRKKARIHGWRLDVANEVDMSFWREFRQVVKSADSNSWIVGEVWGDGTPWLKGDQWDSIMGYQFRDAAIRFFAEGTTKPSEFMTRLMQVYDSYVPQVSRNLMNLLSSHDPPRFVNLCKGNHDLARLAAVVQMTWPGSPSIYYGEEVGMEGEHDPLNRAGMEWSKVGPNNKTLGLYKRLVAARNASKALRLGTPIALQHDDTNRTFAFARKFGEDFAIIVVNRSDKEQTIGVSNRSIRSEGSVEDILSGKTYRLGSDNLSLNVGPLSAAVLVPSQSGKQPILKSRIPNKVQS
ncbi:MAG TPA: alpha amylase N-terminal ig-like domain-containing protein [Fimbriimonadaceae bacterium]|nr:alpha amylase N-terminal ig-like domain-containing protein [Fimbriimonadaceae bacterium]